MQGFIEGFSLDYAGISFYDLSVTFFQPILFLSLASAACANDVNEHCYTVISEQLTAQTNLLASVQDSSSAQNVISSYKTSMQRLKELNNKVTSDNQFSLYLDNQAERKRALQLQIIALSKQLQRLQAVKCYGVVALVELLYPPAKEVLPPKE